MKKFILVFKLIIISGLMLLFVSTSVWLPVDESDRIRFYSRSYEFDYFGWTIHAAWQKLSAISLGATLHLGALQQRKIVKDYFQALADTQNLKNSLETLNSDPNSSKDKNESIPLEKNYLDRKNQLSKLSLLSETVIQDQLSQTLDSLGLADFKQPFPPVLYQVTDLPNELIISPRNIIRQEKSISLRADITPNEEITLENDVEKNPDYSALVVPIGGVSTYPTMVISTNNLLDLVDTVAHEWTHNLLIFRPLGWNYSTTPALRTMNETTASIAGEEISWLLVHQFYSDLIGPENSYSYRTYEALYSLSAQTTQAEFDFRQEMYLTRIKVDELLAQNKVSEAEQYMEARRKVFWDNGYQIRKLNQAYFAFYGAYANEPYSAAGTDPVGNDVRILRAKSANLFSFIQKISGMSSYDQLKQAVNAY